MTKSEVKRKLCRFIFNIDRALLKELKQRALNKDIPVSVWLHEAILEHCRREDSYK